VALPRSSFAICQYALNSAKSVSSALERSLLAVILAVAIGTVQGALVVAASLDLQNRVIDFAGEWL
jgi:hypothetical protein